MKKLFAGVAALAAVALALPAGANAQSDAEIMLLHGIPGVPVDVAVDGEVVIPNFEPGDMQYVCNHSIAHSRTAYEDFAEPEKRRHLLRLWLACDDGPELPEAFTGEHQGQTAGGRPDGIKVPGVELVAPLRAED